MYLSWLNDPAFLRKLQAARIEHKKQQHTALKNRKAYISPKHNLSRVNRGG